ncbi:MAG: hypothetical protein ACOC9N_00275 [Gemmatimonadota bacterium]
MRRRLLVVRAVRLCCAALLGSVVHPGPAVPTGPGAYLSAQEASDETVRVARAGSLRVAARASADTVEVGEPFTIGVVVRGGEGSGPAIPRLLEAGESWEQLEVARIESTETEAGEIRAYYRLVAWEPGRLELPVLRIEDGGGDDRAVEVELPGPRVRSVLPEGAAAEELKLRGPRAPLESGRPWWVWALLALLAAALAAWWWRRHLAADDAEDDETRDVPDPAELARDALVALRERAAAGELGAGEFYDRLEEILRRYLAASHEWPPTRPVRSAAWARRDAMLELHRRAVFSRFAGVEADERRLVSDADVSLEWITGDAA